MSSNSKIEWCDATWTPLRARRKDDGKIGVHCERISPGCQHCYSSTFNKRRLPNQGTGLDFTIANRDKVDIFLDEKILAQPLKWKTEKRIFVCSQTDLFAGFVPFEFIDRVFAVMALCPQHTFQILTKRADRMREYIAGAYQRVRNQVDEGDVYTIYFHSLSRFEREHKQTQWWTDLKQEQWPLKNLWLGCSVETQEWANKRIPELLRIPAAVRFISYEPALSEVSLPTVCRSMKGPCWCGMHISTTDFLPIKKPKCPIDLVIVGGESGPGARPFDVKWARHMRQQAYEMHFALFVKQMGSLPIVAACRQNHFEWGEGAFAEYNATHWKIKLKDRKGGDMNEWADDLRVRQLPK